MSSDIDWEARYQALHNDASELLRHLDKNTKNHKENFDFYAERAKEAQSDLCSRHANKTEELYGRYIVFSTTATTLARILERDHPSHDLLKEQHDEDKEENIEQTQ
jgi:hypothetical protein